MHSNYSANATNILQGHEHHHTLEITELATAQFTALLQPIYLADFSMKTRWAA
jgi:hypothetical protein